MLSDPDVTGVVTAALAGCALSLLFLLARTDLRQRRLPNVLVLAYAAFFLPWAWLHGLSWAQAGLHLMVGGGGFLVLLLLFAVRCMGGGDVKLGAAVLFWAGPLKMLPVIAVVAWTGALIGILGWLCDRYAALCMKNGRPLADRRWLHALSARRGVPYGVALAAGGLCALWS
ncbi:peptidase A24 [Alcaligenaceae bacterium SJ-26]|nr:peptidase A24 [Alcaligenaceae bacterium SJ-26]